MSDLLPDNYRIKVAFYTSKMPDLVLIGLMKKRRWWFGYREVCTAAVPASATNEEVVAELLRRYREENLPKDNGLWLS